MQERNANFELREEIAEREKERILAQDSDAFNNFKIRQICTYVHVFTNLKEFFDISRDSVQFSAEQVDDEGFEDLER